MKANTLQSLIHVQDGVLSEVECAACVTLLRMHPEHIEHHDTLGYKFTQLNLTTANELRISQAFASRLEPIVNSYFSDRNLRQYIPEYGYEDVRIKKYVAGSEDVFRTHVDAWDAASAKRFLIAIVYLNDNDGSTQFPTLGMTVEPKVGRLVLFPPMWMFPHSGNSPTAVDKHIIMTSLNYL